MIGTAAADKLAIPHAPLNHPFGAGCNNASHDPVALGWQDGELVAASLYGVRCPVVVCPIDGIASEDKLRNGADGASAGRAGAKRRCRHMPCMAPKRVGAQWARCRAAPMREAYPIPQP